MNIKQQTLSALALLCLPFAASASTDRILVAPDCLIKAALPNAVTLAKQQTLSLIKVSNTQVKQLTEAKHQLNATCGGFMDVTTAWRAHHQKALANDNAFLKTYSQPSTPALAQGSNYAIRYEKQVNELLSQLNPQLMWDSLTTFTSFHDRYADSDTGVAAAKWIGAQVEGAAKTANRDDVTVSYVATDSYEQPSVVVKVGNSHAAGVVVGAHLDTTSGSFSNKPGADDDGSGSMTVLESARTVISSNMKFNKPIYFIWYAAEEEGLLGSQAVVADFQKKQIPVDGVMHFDMTGFAYKNSMDIWVMDDYTNKPLTTFLSDIIKTYTHRNVQHTRCGYPCSDHASWNMAGYKAVLPAEARFEDSNPVMHSSRDTMDRLSLTHMTDYAKIATAFAVEMAEPATK